MSSRDVVILGAGFSHAVSTQMPLLNTLGDAAVDRAGLKGDPRVPKFSFDQNFTFENWLSSLAEDQPHLSRAENGENYALFARLRDSMIAVLEEAEQSVFETAVPSWLARLTALLHHREATVITFNYDRLLEVTLERLGIVHASTVSPRAVWVGDILEAQPPLTPNEAVWGGEIAPTFRLLKLHGSLDWWIAPNDDSGASLARHRLTLADGVPRRLTEVERSRLLPGREVFIVPPTLSKMPYFRNFLTRELWSKSFDALSEARNISIVGYSMPPADVMLLGMLERATRSGKARAEVVNPDAAELSKRLARMNFTEVVPILGDDCLPQFVEQYAERAELDFRDSMRYEGPVVPPDFPVVVTTKIAHGQNLYSRVIDLDTGVDSSELIIKAVSRGLNPNVAASSDPFGEYQPRPMAVEIAKALEGVTRVRVDIDGALLQPVKVEYLWGPTVGGAKALLISVLDIE